MTSTDLEAFTAIDVRQLEELRAQIAPDASNDELALYATVCNHLRLDPWRGQIHLVPRYDKRAKRMVHRPQIAIDGRRAMAVRTGELVGIEGPWWCGPRQSEREDLRWLDVWDREGEPYAAKVLVHRAGWLTPSNGTCKWSEFAQTDSQGQLLSQWRQMPAHMLAKSAESLALRRAFPEVIGQAIVSLDVEDDDADLLDRPAQPLTFSTPGPTPEQQGQASALFEALGLDGPDMRPARLEVASTALGRRIDDMRQLDREDTAVLIEHLHQLHQQWADEQLTDPEGEDDADV